jgi:hypothetical protein
MPEMATSRTSNLPGSPRESGPVDCHSSQFDLVNDGPQADLRVGEPSNALLRIDFNSGAHRVHQASGTQASKYAGSSPLSSK